MEPSSHPQKFIFPSTRPICSLSLSRAINCQCLLHWVNHLAAKLNAVCEIECVQPLLACWKKNLVPPHTSTPPGSTCRVFTSPPPPLVIRKLQGGGTSNLVPNKSCCRWILSVQNKYSMVVQLPIRRKIEKYRSDLPGNLKVSRVTCQLKGSWRWRHPASNFLPTSCVAFSPLSLPPSRSDDSSKLVLGSWIFGRSP